MEPSSVSSISLLMIALMTEMYFFSLPNVHWDFVYLGYSIDSVSRTVLRPQ